MALTQQAAGHRPPDMIAPPFALSSEPIELFFKSPILN